MKDNLTVHNRLFRAQHFYEQGYYIEADTILKKLYAQWKNDQVHFCMMDELKLFVLLELNSRKIKGE